MPNPCESLKAASQEISRGIRTREVMEWWDFVQLVKTELLDAPGLVYRGQATDWPLEATIDRLEKKYPTKTVPIFGESQTFDCPPMSRMTHLNAFKEAVRGRLRNFPVDASDDEYWTLAQHHGLATPLVDWTYYPFAALYFAFEEEAIIKDDRRIIPSTRYVYSLAWHVFKENTNDRPYPYVPKLAGSARYLNQQACSLVMPRCQTMQAVVEELISNNTSLREAQKYGQAILEVIPIRSDESQRRECLKFLDKMGVNRLTLFPDVDGAASYINRLWELVPGSPLGAIGSDQPTTSD